MNRFICIHGHFYQPPRENPWLEEVELQDSAYPYHDWNERVTAECYSPNASARILDSEGRIQDIVNNYSKISFNFGPSLLSWLERHKPEIYAAIREADRISLESFSSHGAALAQVYSHMIMPLANARDKRTQVIWGIRDFQHRFKRLPEGMWLSETAVDLETLEALAEQGLRFTILTPSQAKRIRRIGDKRWKDVSGGRIDPKQAYLCRLPSGREISLFFYDGPIAQDVAFGGLLNNGGIFAQRLQGVFAPESEQPQLVHIATDGESYGHHHRYGDMALSYCLHSIQKGRQARLTVYGEYLAAFPPVWEVEIFENTSWSCAHGIERWRSDCGCHIQSTPGGQQIWRGPLRQAMDWLRDSLAPLFAREMGGLCPDPWKARDEYIGVILDRSEENLGRFIAAHAGRALNREEETRFLKLLEMQRHAMLMFTSCGWFFDDISGIESVQVLNYAARALQLAREAGRQDFEAGFRQILAQAPSSSVQYENGAQLWDSLVKPAVSDLLKVGAHYAVSSLFQTYSQESRVYCYQARALHYTQEALGEQKLAVGRAIIRSLITREEQDIVLAILHLGDHNLFGGVGPYHNQESFQTMQTAVTQAFAANDIPEIIRLMDDYFGMHHYSLRSLFKDEQRKILGRLLKNTVQELEVAYRHIFARHYPVFHMLNDMHVPLPKALSTTVEFILNTDLRKLLDAEMLDVEKLQKTVEEIKRWGFKRDKANLGFMAARKINSMMDHFARHPEGHETLLTIEHIIRIMRQLPLDMDLWKAQNLYYMLGRRWLASFKTRAGEGDAAAGRWVEAFQSLGRALRVMLP